MPYQTDVPYYPAEEEQALRKQDAMRSAGLKRPPLVQVTEDARELQERSYAAADQAEALAEKLLGPEVEDGAIRDGATPRGPGVLDGLIDTQSQIRRNLDRTQRALNRLSGGLGL